MALGTTRVRGALIATTAATALGIGMIAFAAQSSAETNGSAAGSSASPDRVQALTTLPPPVAPAVKFTVTGDARGVALVKWEAAETPSGVTFTSYSVYFYDTTPKGMPPTSPGGSPPPTQPPRPVASQNLPITARSAEFTGLNTGATYEVHVVAYGPQGMTTDSPKLLRTASAFLTTTPAIAVYGAPVTLSGVTPRAGEIATLERLPAGTSTWIRVGALRTGADRKWTLVTRPAETTAYRVSNAGSEGTWPTTMTRTVTVRYLVSVKASNTRPKPHQTITVTGAVRPIKAGVKVSLQRYSAGAWVTIAGSTLRADGSYSIAKAFAKGTWPLRVVAAGGGTLAYGTSSQVTVIAK
ncbi:fibronectin type III domain-containing protein [Actinoplanes sp. LDG1-06]|uniref:Fibronectin type III domain-containing protein n=1 Tax=Paractinoplanes ovalisporus TaxID=2810368 RepID=A0ABS2A3F1_9ACTN|nr:fibronectin type III domain-containing protein [Actinoplanes ovalisporus]MBM2614368.1 fibronectin type III domain-containing protein [Actinoplanes ovalisporus]